MNTKSSTLVRMPNTDQWEPFGHHISMMKTLAAEKGLPWELPVSADGYVLPEIAWDLRTLNGHPKKHATRLFDFSVDKDIRQLALESGIPTAKLPQADHLSKGWQDLSKALIVYKCTVEQRTPIAAMEVHRAVRALASLTSHEPWQLTAEDVHRGLSFANTRAKKFKAICTYFDENFLSTAVPLRAEVLSRLPAPVGVLQNLNEQKSSEKLPERDALYELARIVWREEPRSYYDAIRFYAIRLLLLTGLRVYEIASLPEDCIREEALTLSATGRAVEKIGGARTAMYLRYFAEKTASRKSAMHLYEKRQYIPARFQEIVRKTVEQARAATENLRYTLRNQFACGCRHLWQYGPNENINAETACQLFGLAWPAANGDSHRALLAKTFGVPVPEVPEMFAADYLEHWLSGTVRKKSDFRSFLLSDETSMPASELLFLIPAGHRDLAPSRHATFAAVGTLQSMQINVALGGKGDEFSIFGRYSQTPALKKCKLNPHMLRHLLNTELFRQGLSDTIITHHFGRESVAQSYEYDHRTLLEKLDFIDLPQVGQDLLGGSPAELVGKMVVGGLAPESHISKTFKKVQAEHGDEVAFEYLKANADGFHVTPYGFCTNSFSLNPCARHLKCFDNCRHFVASEKPEHKITLESLKKSLIATRDQASAKPLKTVGRKNQIDHANKLLTGIEAALAATPGNTIFPQGVDHSTPPKGVFE